MLWLAALKTPHDDLRYMSQLQRFETAEHWLIAFRQGELQPHDRRTLPLLEREPLKVWRTVALLSLVINLLMLAWMLKP